MNNNALKQLRQQLNIPVIEAVQLSKENQNDIAVCTQQYHKIQIEKLIEMAQCEPILEQTQYQAFACNFEKALSSIHSIQHKSSIVVFTTSTDKQKISGEIGIFVWKEPKLIEQKEQRAFIPLDDFKYLLDTFNSVFLFRRSNLY